MPLSLKQKAIRSADCNFLQQQKRCDGLIGLYNDERPHQALVGACPVNY